MTMSNGNCRGYSGHGRRTRAFTRLVLALGIGFAGLAPALAADPAMAVDSGLPQLIYLPANTPQADHASIIQAFSDAGFQVTTYSNQGEEGTVYARRIAGEIKALMSQGVNPARITVVGSGSGSTVAQLASAATGNRNVNYVLLGRCDAALKDQVRFKMAGRVLGIRDAGTKGSGSCRRIWVDSPRVGERRDMVLNTGLGDALFYQPHADWMQPTLDWTQRGSVDVGEIKVSMR